MKPIKITLLVMGLLIALLIVQGCQIGVPIEVVVAPLVGHLSPSRGHPDFDTTVIIQKTGGTYLYEVTGHDPVTSTENTFDTTVDAWPWSCKVTWMQGDEIGTLTLTPTLVNSPPTIRQPWMAGGYAVPFWRTLLNFRYYGASCGSPATGITDPEGDEWRVTSITIQCEYNDEPDTLFYPSIFGIKEFYVDASSGCNTIEVYPAAIWYPGYVAEIQSGSGLPFSISKKDGKSVDGDRGYPVLNPFVSPLFRAQDATITVTAEDSFGASSTESFIIHIIAYTG